MEEPDFAALKALIIARTGHFYYEDKDRQLRERVQTRMDALRIRDLTLYRQRLEDPVAGPGEWRLLESAITINETFFFRFAEQFDALRRTLLPQLIETRRDGRRIRIWSVGCSTGAEPYSIAILLHDLLGGAFADWHIAIVATDIDEAALEVARAARFGRWALRGMDAAERERLFETEGDRFVLRSAFRGGVRFQRHNLMSLLDGSTPIELDEFDLILCRNVLIYFRPDVAAALVAALAARLVPAGLLLVGHAESGMAAEAGLKARTIDGIVVYPARGHQDEPEQRPAPSPVAPVPPPWRKETRPPPAPSRGLPSKLPPPMPAGATAAAASNIDAIRLALADGDFRAAAARCDEALARDPENSLLHYLGALGAAAAGDRRAAEEGFRRALYLDSGFAMAHYLLGLTLISEGREQAGRRCLRNAGRAVAGLDPESWIAEGEGITAADLRRAVDLRLREAAE